MTLISKNIPEKLMNPNTAEAAYVLGFLFAEGAIENNKSNSRVGVFNLKTDMEHLVNIFMSLGNWKMRYINNKNRQTVINLRLSSKVFINFLLEHDYVPNTGYSACKILAEIPKKLHPYWFRGLTDGDGCFYKQKTFKDKKRNSGTNRYSCFSRYDQDWIYFENLLKELNIKYSIQYRIRNIQNKEHKSSVLCFSKRNDIIKFGDYIYQNYPEDGIGLPRKYEKFLQIKNYNPATFKFQSLESKQPISC